VSVNEGTLGEILPKDNGDQAFSTGLGLLPTMLMYKESTGSQGMNAKLVDFSYKAGYFPRGLVVWGFGGVLREKKKNRKIPHAIRR